MAQQQMGSGIMDLVSRLLAERESVTGKLGLPKGLKKGSVSDKEFKLMTDKAEMPDNLRGLKPATNNFLKSGGMSDEEFDILKNGGNTYGATSDGGSYSNSNITGGQQQFINAMNTVEDGALSGFVQHNTPTIQGMGVDSISMQDMKNLPADAMRSQFMDIFKSSKLSGFPEGKPSQASAVGAVSEREAEALQRSELNTMGVDGVSSDIDTMFAQALQGMSPDKASDVIMTLQQYTPDQQINFKQQFLSGNVPQYELEAQSNLGF